MKTFAEFWPFYLRAHSKKSTRTLHAFGSILALTMVSLAITVSPWFLVAAPILGYGFAWYAHFFVEGNKPATFGHPLWSLAADYRMLGLVLIGKMDAEIAKVGIEN